MSVRTGLLAAWTLTLLFGSTSVGASTAQTEASGPDDAYTVWLCPMHRDHQAHDEGRCPLCGMALVRRTLVTRYVCLGQEKGVVEEGPGTCARRPGNRLFRPPVKWSGSAPSDP